MASWKSSGLTGLSTQPSCGDAYPIEHVKLDWIKHLSMVLANKFIVGKL